MILVQSGSVQFPWRALADPHCVVCYRQTLHDFLSRVK